MHLTEKGKSAILAMAERFSVEGLATEWEGFENIRNRLRSEDGRLVIRNEDQTYDPSNRLAILNLDLLAPMLVRMTLCKLKIPDIEPLRSTVQQVYQLVSKEPSDSQIDDEAWALRHLVGHVKRKTQKQLVSLDPGNLHNLQSKFEEPDFQDMCLILNPDLEDAFKVRTWCERFGNVQNPSHSIRLMKHWWRLMTVSQLGLEFLSSSKKLQLKMLQDELRKIREKRAKYDPSMSLQPEEPSPGRPEPTAAAALVTPPCKNSIGRYETDNAETQQFDIMGIDLSQTPVTPEFNKPQRFPSTTSVDTKRWAYQHPNEPKPEKLSEAPPALHAQDEKPSAAPPALPAQDEKPCAAPPALPAQEELQAVVEEPMHDAEDDAVQDDGAAPDGEASPPTKVFGRREQLGLRKKIKESRKKADPADDQGSKKKLKRKSSKSKLARLKKMRRSRSSFEDLEGPEEHAPAEEEEQEPQAKSKSKAKPNSKSAPKAEAAKPKSKSAPKAKAAAKSKATPKAKATSPKCKASSKKASSSKSHEDNEAEPAEKPKSKGGRPKGSKNKVKEADNDGKKARAARVAPSIRLNRKSADETPHDPEDYDYILQFVHDFEDPEAELPVLKKQVKEWKPQWTYVAPDIYWECALTFYYQDDEGTDCKSNVGHFHFANNKPAQLVAIACSYLLAACL
ncbi:unnamed protein product [Symbiodinium sp. CCMP2592]|nr:unnamed protein product [Symbiodinium sp. CCMP2592]